MGLLSIFKRRAETAAAGSASSDTADAVQQARVRARQRLIGAAVLVVIGIVGFPLVFETQPRPIPVDIPIEVPRKEGAPALVMPSKAPAPSASASVAPAAAPVATAADDVITESREEAGRSVAPAVAAEAAPKPVEAKPDQKPEPKTEPKPEPKTATRPEPKPAAAADAAKARALLEGKVAVATPPTPAPDATDAGRFVVQVGAFADAAAARETRVKVEKLGLKTYTQVASTPAGNRIRVRVGPFGTRDEAAKAQAKAKGAGLTAVVLTL